MVDTKTRKIVVNGYTYETDLPVRVGSNVLLPAAQWKPDVNEKATWSGLITALESDYSGPCKRILEVLSY